MTLQTSNGLTMKDAGNKLQHTIGAQGAGHDLSTSRLGAVRGGCVYAAALAFIAAEMSALIGRSGLIVGGATQVVELLS